MKPEDVRESLARTYDGGGGQDDPSARDLALGPATATLVPATPTPAIPAPTEEAVFASISASYFRLRRGLAWLALAFPVVLVLVDIANPQPSLSAYYHYIVPPGEAAAGAGTMRDLFVGALWAIGAFLVFYKGYDRKEDVVLDVAGVAAVLIAMLPMDWTPPGTPAAAAATLRGGAHNASAVAFFLAIAYVCIWRSCDTLQIMTDKPLQRRFQRTYNILGGLMIVVPLTILAIDLAAGPKFKHVTLLLEAAAIYVFATFWLVKSHEIAILERRADPRLSPLGGAVRALLP